MSATIVFRGLMAFHYMEDYMEIGLLNAMAHPDGEPQPHVAHVPRIITSRNGVVSSIYDLRKHPDKLGPVRDWEIVASNPTQPTATRFRQGEHFDRLHHPFAKDFRWLVDLEGEDLHDRDLTAELDTSRLLMVLRVRHGLFYTHQLSKPLNRSNANPPPREQDFGRAAEVVGCKIGFEIGTLDLMAGKTHIFSFDQGDEDGVIYEISNAPPDVLPDHKYDPGPGHFAMYYTHLFRNPRLRGLPDDEFLLVPVDEGSEPSPDPALCGAIDLGKRDGGL
jgi:hypothetical protein